MKNIILNFFFFTRRNCKNNLLINYYYLSFYSDNNKFNYFLMDAASLLFKRIGVADKIKCENLEIPEQLEQSSDPDEKANKLINND